VKLVLEPLPRGTGIEMKNELMPETIPEEFHSVIEESLGEAVLSGVMAGYPVQDVKVRITGGSFREGESSPVGYKISAATAFRDGCSKAGPVLLEPIMRVDILTPRDFMGEVIGDINARKGEVESVTPKGPVTEIKANVPLRKLFGYSTDLRSATQGRAIFTMQFLRYDKA
jgi:elongation factor G